MNKIAAFVIGLLTAAGFALPAGAESWYYEPYDYEYYYGYDIYVPTYDYGYYDYTYYYYYPAYHPTYTQYYAPTTYYYPTQYGYSTPSPSNYRYPVGDTDTFGYDLCHWEGYGRGRCDSNPRQPVYDHWTGTWY